MGRPKLQLKQTHDMCKSSSMSLGFEMVSQWEHLEWRKQIRIQHHWMIWTRRGFEAWLWDAIIWPWTGQTSTMQQRSWPEQCNNLLRGTGAAWNGLQGFFLDDHVWSGDTLNRRNSCSWKFSQTAMTLGAWRHGSRQTVDAFFMVNICWNFTVQRSMWLHFPQENRSSMGASRLVLHCWELLLQWKTWAVSLMVCWFSMRVLQNLCWAEGAMVRPNISTDATCGCNNMCKMVTWSLRKQAQRWTVPIWVRNTWTVLEWWTSWTWWIWSNVSVRSRGKRESSEGWFPRVLTRSLCFALT